MPRVKVKKTRVEIPSKYLMALLCTVCVVLMIVTYSTDVVSNLLSNTVAASIVPFQSGLSSIGTYLSSGATELKELRSVRAENETLKERISELEIENSKLYEEKYELNTLRSLYELDQKYADYEKVGARIIGKDAGNWFSTFVVDKGSDDGIEVNMNVMSGSGLVGIITQVGPNWAQVRSIIDDQSNVSATVLSTNNPIIVTGNLGLMDTGNIQFSQLLDEEGNVVEGDLLVTSDISDKFLPGINIGYISSIEKDANNLTKSGTVTPCVDFDHLDVVLIIKQLKHVKD